MDAFNALWDNPEQRRRPPDDDFKLFTMEEWLAKSSTHKILTGSFRCPLPPELEPRPQAFQCRRQKVANNKISTPGCSAQNNNNGQNQQNQRQTNTNYNDSKIYVPGLLKVPVPDKLSDLSRDEQKDCLRLFQKFEGNPVANLTPSDKAEYQLFQSLFTRVQAEQKEFLHHAKQDWLDYADRTSKIKGDPYKFVLQHWTDKVTYAMAQYPKNYKRSRMVSLLHESNKRVQMHMIKNILNIGKVPIAKLPQFDAPFRTATSLIRLRTWRYLNVPQTQLTGTLHRVPVSRDPNAERLARLHGAEVVMSTSAFKCLLDNHDEKKHPHHSGVGKSWIIPVIVKEHRTFCDGKPITKTIVFFDKVLPPSKMTKFENVCIYQKHAMLASLIHRHHEGGVEFEVKGDDIMIIKVEEPVKNASDKVNNQPTLSETKQKDNVLSSDSSELKGNLNSSSLTENTESTNTQVSEGNSVKVADDDSDDEFTLCIALSDEEPNAKQNPTDISNSSKNQAECESDVESRTQAELTDPLTSEGPKENVQKTLESEPRLIHSEEKSIIPSSIKSTNTSQDEAVNNLTTISNIQIECNESQIVEGSAEQNQKILDSQTKLCVQSNENSKVTNRWENIPPPPPVKTVNGNALPPNTTNVVYNLWSFESEDEHSDLSTKHINILIRSHIDGCELLDHGGYAPLSFAVKPEYQLEYGAGVVPLSDLTRQWAKLLIQPDCTLARVRVNVKTSEMVKLEKYSKEEIAAEAKLLHNKDLSQNLLSLHGILSDLKSLPTGQYLLSHTPEMGLQAELFKSTNGDEAVDWRLHEGYNGLPGEIGSDVPWQPLDPKVILPKNLLFHSMPCTFSTRWTADIKPKKK